jgi:hypothetical protein
MKETCERYDPFIEQYIADDLPDDLKCLMEAHIAVCPVCRHKIELATKLENSLTVACLPEVPLGFAKSVAFRISEQAQSKAAPSYATFDLWWLVPWLSLAASAVFFAFKFDLVSLPSLTTIIPKIISNPTYIAVTIGLFALTISATLSTAIIGYFAAKK